MSDLLTDALNAPAGRLAEILLKKLTKGEADREMPDEMQARFEKLIHAEGRLGQLARVRLAAEVSYLFEHAPKWTAENLVPLFSWSSPDALAAWSSRKYSTYIGSPRLIGLVKEPFLALFGRVDVPDHDIDIFASWLTAMMLAKKVGYADYPITDTEARMALRKAGTKGMSSVAHRFAIEMEKVKDDEKMAKWRDVVSPVFKAIWPLDAELQTSATTFKLVQILRATGDAFPEAADEIIPFIRPEDGSGPSSVFSISNAPEVIYSSSPAKLLDLLWAVLGDTPARRAFGLDKTLERIRQRDPKLANTRKFQKLVS